MTKKYLSATMIKNLISCFDYESDKNIKKNFAAERGSVIHALLEGVKPETIQTLGTDYRGAYSILEYPNEHDWTEYARITESANKEFLGPLKDMGFLKQEVEFTIDYDEDTTITGVIDGLWVPMTNDKIPMIFDFKTGQTPIDLSNPMDSVQSVVYPWLYMRKSGVKKVVFAYVWIDEDGISAIDRKEITLDYAESQLAIMLQEIKNQNMNIGQQCRYCAKRDICGKVKGTALMLNPKQNVDLSVKTPENYKIVSAMAKVIDKWIEDYKENAPAESFTTMNLTYLDTSELTLEEKAELVGSRVRISKEKAAKYDPKSIITIASKRFKG